MIDPNTLPYRANVGAALFNHAGKILIARRTDLNRFDSHPWQLPQGGIDADEDPRLAVLRELREEIGTDHATILAAIPGWLTYEFPPEVIARFGNRHRGQRQRWFALRFTGTDMMIRLDADPHPEFSEWRWAELADIAALAVPFKRHIYQRVATEFARFATKQGD
ncbi:MAG: RNA pyrophosphohydrolase [Acidiphilium sp.]|nr:RNA pyrophosphohydrolase [Acidiphilium sp.]MDD4935006.1 RNA pyrophosphohydrolase [Acidiphilium sp.]